MKGLYAARISLGYILIAYIAFLCVGLSAYGVREFVKHAHEPLILKRYPVYVYFTMSAVFVYILSCLLNAFEIMYFEHDAPGEKTQNQTHEILFTLIWILASVSRTGLELGIAFRWWHVLYDLKFGFANEDDQWMRYIGMRGTRDLFLAFSACIHVYTIESLYLFLFLSKECIWEYLYRPGYGTSLSDS